MGGEELRQGGSRAAQPGLLVGIAAGLGVDHRHAGHGDASRSIAPADAAAWRLRLGDDDDLVHLVTGVAADDEATGRGTEASRELPLHEAEVAGGRYGPLRDVLAFSAALDGATRTVGFSISPRRSIRRDHWLGLRTALSCLASLLLVPYCGVKPMWM